MNNHMSKRSRGRPIGTGLDDGPTLKKVADMIVANPSLRPTTAIRRVLDKPEPSNIRRLQVKWKTGSVEYLADAQARRAVALTPARRGSTHSPRTFRQLAEVQQKAIQRAIQDATGGTRSTALDSPAQRAALEYMNSPAFKAAEEAMCRYKDSPATRALLELQNSPAMRATEELRNSPTMRAMRELQDSPMMRAAREMEKVQRLISGGF